MTFESRLHLADHWSRALNGVQQHWAVLVILTVFFVILAPSVAQLGLHSDDYNFVYASTHHDFRYFVDASLTASRRPLYALAVYHVAKLFYVNQPALHLAQFALHIGLCVLLYALCLRLQRDRGMATACAAFVAIMPLHAEAALWFSAWLYLVGAWAVLLAAYVSTMPTMSSQRRNVIVFFILFIGAQFCELTAVIAAGIVVGIWLIRRQAVTRWRQAVPGWVLGSLCGFGFLKLMRHLSGYSQPLLWNLSLAKFLGPFRVYLGWTTQGIGLQWLMDHLWVLPGIVIILGTVAIMARRSDLQRISRMRPLLVPCILATLGGTAPFVFSTYFPVRALYPVAPWMLLALIILLYWIFRRAAWLPLLFILALSMNATFGTVSAYRHANLIQQQYIAAFRTALPKWPAEARSICARNAPANYGPISTFKDYWVLSGALAQEYDLDFEPDVYFTDRYPRCNRASPDITAIWDARQRVMEIELPADRSQAHTAVGSSEAPRK